MDCKRTEKKLIFYIENELDEKESILIQGHIDACTECRSLYNQLKNSLEYIQNDILKESNPFFYTRLAEVLEANKRPLYGWIKQKQLILQTALYAFIVLIALFAGIYLGSGYTVNDQAIQQLQIDTTDYQLFAKSYQYHFSEDVYVVESSSNE